MDTENQKPGEREVLHPSDGQPALGGTSPRKPKTLIIVVSILVFIACFGVVLFLLFKPDPSASRLQQSQKDDTTHGTVLVFQQQVKNDSKMTFVHADTREPLKSITVRGGEVSTMIRSGMNFRSHIALFDQSNVGRDRCMGMGCEGSHLSGATFAIDLQNGFKRLSIDSEAIRNLSSDGNIYSEFGNGAFVSADEIAWMFCPYSDAKGYDFQCRIYTYDVRTETAKVALKLDETVRLAGTRNTPGYFDTLAYFEPVSAATDGSHLNLLGCPDIDHYRFNAPDGLQYAYLCRPVRYNVQSNSIDWTGPVIGSFDPYRFSISPDSKMALLSIIDRTNQTEYIQLTRLNVGVAGDSKFTPRSAEWSVDYSAEPAWSPDGAYVALCLEEQVHRGKVRGKKKIVVLDTSTLAQTDIDTIEDAGNDRSMTPSFLGWQNDNTLLYTRPAAKDQAARSVSFEYSLKDKQLKQLDGMHGELIGILRAE